MKSVLFLAAIAAIAVFAVSCGKSGNAENVPFRTLSMEEGISLYSQLLSDDNLPENEKPVLLDVRHDDEYAEGHIPGAKLLTMETITPENSAEMIKDKKQPAFVYCRSGARSKAAAEKLASYGYENITNIGGIMSYNGELEKD